MKKMTALLLSLVMLLTVCPSAMAYTLFVGELVAVPPCDLSILFPQEYAIAEGSFEGFSVGYASNSMLVGIAALPFADLDTFHEQRCPKDFATMETVTLGDNDFFWFTPVKQQGLAAILLCQARKDMGYLELSFYPRNPDDHETNRKLISEIASTVRCRSDMIAADFETTQSVGFEHLGLGLRGRLPVSVIKQPVDRCINDEIVIYQNDYLTIRYFGYEGTIDEYCDTFGITANHFYISENTNPAGVHFYVFEPMDPYSDPAIAYCVAEGRNGQLLEIVFQATALNEVDENWFYISTIVTELFFIEE